MARKKELDEDYILQLKEKREKLNNELIETAIQIADLGKKLYELKEELRITEIQLGKLDNPTIHVIIPSEADKKRFIEIVNEIINLISAKTKNIEEKAFVLKMLVEGFQDSTKSKIPIQ